MPIVNGTYVPDTLGDAKTAQQSVFGSYTKKDMNDYSTAAYNYLQKQQEQAYNLQLWQLNNEYNSPAEQMKRYQDAGLNPNLIYSQQNTAQAPASASAASFRPSNLAQKQQANAISMIGQVMNTVKAARETYDYMKYGRETSAWNRNLTMQKSQGQALQNYWDQYLLGMDSENSTVRTGPRAQMYKYQLDTQQQRYEQLKAMANMIPDQAARQRALKALDDERLNIMQAQNGFITNFNTGHPDFDSFFKMLAYFVMNSGT